MSLSQDPSAPFGSEPPPRPRRPYPLKDAPFPAWVDCLLALAVVVAAVVVVYGLAQVDPDARGHGTHEQFGMQPCGWPAHYGIPCPTCGATTAAAHLVHLSPLRSLWTQPFGTAMALAGLWAALLSLHSLWTRQSLLWRIAFMPMHKYMLWGMVLLGVSWGFKWLTWEDASSPLSVLPAWDRTESTAPLEVPPGDASEPSGR